MVWSRKQGGRGSCTGESFRNGGGRSEAEEKTKVDMEAMCGRGFERNAYQEVYNKNEWERLINRPTP